MRQMKFVMAGFLALALAAPAFAAEVKISGDFNNRFGYSSDWNTIAKSSDTTDYLNVLGVIVPNGANTTNKQDDDSDFFGEAKYRLHFTASDDEKKVKGVAGFEFGGRTYGSTQMDFGGDDRDFLEVQYLYTDIEVPFDTASRFTMGLQPVGYNKFVWSDNAAGLKYSSKRGFLGYSLGWFRNDSSSVGSATKDDNDDVYAADMTFTFAPTGKVNIFALYKEDGRYNSDLGVAGGIGGMNKEYWTGAALDAQIQNFFFGGTLVYLFGEVADFGKTAVIPGRDLDREAWLANAEMTLKVDKARFKLGYLFASGDDDALDSELNNYDAIDVYMGGFGSVVVFDSLADDNTLVASPYYLDKGLSMPYLAADFDITEKTSVGASYLYIMTAEKLDIARPSGISGDDEIGHEFAVRASHTIAKGLTAGVEVGYLLGGDLWDNYAPDDEDSDNVLRADASIRFKF